MKPEAAEGRTKRRGAFFSRSFSSPRKHTLAHFT
jgi:hypothetical protein